MFVVHPILYIQDSIFETSSVSPADFWESYIYPSLIWVWKLLIQYYSHISHMSRWPMSQSFPFWLKFCSLLQGGLCHNNVCVSSIFVAEDGSWKLGGLEYLCSYEQATVNFLEKHRSKRNQMALAPEEKVTGQQPVVTKLTVWNVKVFCKISHNLHQIHMGQVVPTVVKNIIWIVGIIFSSLF